MAPRSLDVDKAQLSELARDKIGIVRQSSLLLGSEAVEDSASLVDLGPKQVEQRVAIAQSVELGDIVECGRISRKQVGLCVVNHLHAMLDRAQQAVRLCKFPRLLRVEAVRGDQRRDGVQCRGSADAGIAPAVDHLLDLHEELDLADPPAPALQVVAGTDVRTLGEMIADTRRNLANLLDDSEIERAAPDERLDRIEKGLA